MADNMSSQLGDRVKQLGHPDETGKKLGEEGNPKPPEKHPKPVLNPVPRGTAHAGDENKGLDTGPRPTPHKIEPSTPTRTAGIDVSQYQSNIDWNGVQKAGVKFAFIRATVGSTEVDTKFSTNWQNAEKAGVLVGPYHYFTTTSPVSTQVDNFVATMGKVDKGNLPPVLDVEDPKQFANLSADQSVALIQQWLDGVQAKLGVRPMLYMSSAFSGDVLGDAPQLDKYKLWVADWTTKPTPIVDNPPWADWTFWQHANNGRVGGITGDVDLDYFNGSPAQLDDVVQAAAAAAPPDAQPKDPPPPVVQPPDVQPPAAPPHN